MSDTTKIPIDKLSGRELDAAVAEEVVGNDPFEVWVTDYAGDPPQPVKSEVKSSVYHYSTDIAAAWEVWEWIKDDNYPGADQYDTNLSLEVTDGQYFVTVVHAPSAYDVGFNSFGRGATAPEAICRAALKAVRADE